MATVARDVPWVVVHLWGVSRARVPGAVLRMATSRRAVRRGSGLRFAKLLGTGSGETFSIRDADPRHWALLTVWNAAADVRVFEQSSTVTSWDRRCTERARFLLRPYRSRGQWAGTRPFEPVGPPPAADAPIAAITRARIRTGLWRRFSREVPGVAVQARSAPGMLLRTGIGEAPIGLQGTFSVWASNRDLVAFAGTAAHAQAIRHTDELGWYAEELFARFTIEDARGRFAGNDVEGRL